MSRRRIPLGKLRNSQSNASNTLQFENSQERIDEILSRPRETETIGTIIPESRISFEHSKEYSREGKELMKRAVLVTHQIAALFEGLENTDRYYEFIELGRRLISAIDSNNYGEIINILLEWDAYMENPDVIKFQSLIDYDEEIDKDLLQAMDRLSIN